MLSKSTMLGSKGLIQHVVVAIKFLKRLGFQLLTGSGIGAQRSGQGLCNGG